MKCNICGNENSKIHSVSSILVICVECIEILKERELRNSGKQI